MILHLGSGKTPLRNPTTDTVVTLDADERLTPDLVCCLGKNTIPLEDDSVDIAVAHHILEHIGRQGETTEWFFFWEELYRVLKPEGRLEFLAPLWNSVWAWADPSHTRALSPESFVFVGQDNYRIPGSAISPFRVRCDFKPIKFSQEPEGNFSGILVPLKPFVGWWED